MLKKSLLVMTALVVSATAFSGAAFASTESHPYVDTEYQKYAEAHKDDMDQQRAKWEKDQEQARKLFKEQEAAHNAKIAERVKRTQELEARRVEAALKAQKAEAERVANLRKARSERKVKAVTYRAKTTKKANKEIKDLSFLRGYFKK